MDKLNFDEAIKEGVVLVHFYSPTNQACTDVAPILEKLTQKVASDGIKIGKVDCRAADNFNRQLCVDNRVASFPTLNLYKDGVKIVKFPQNGRRTLEEFEYFVKNLEVRADKDELWNSWENFFLL